jgi:hypothetical protein
MQLSMAIGWFFCGFLFNAVVWRLQEGKLNDIYFPIILLILTLAMQLIRYSARK